MLRAWHDSIIQAHQHSHEENSASRPGSWVTPTPFVGIRVATVRDFNYGISLGTLLRLVDKGNVMCTHNGTLSSHNEWNITMC